MKPFRQHAEHADGVSFAVPVKGMPCKQTHTLEPPGSTNFLAEARVYLPQSRATYATRGYNSYTRKCNSPSSRLSPPPNRTDVDTQHSKVPPFSLTTERSVAYTSVRPASFLANGVNYCVQSLATYRSLITASSTFDLFFKVLFTFRSHYFFAIGLLVIFSFRRELPPTLV